MSVTLIAQMYPKEVVKEEYLFYLDREGCSYNQVECDGSKLDKNFYDACKEFGCRYRYPLYPDCYVFTNPVKLVQFIADKRVPKEFHDLFFNAEENEDTMIIWIC